MTYPTLEETRGLDGRLVTHIEHISPTLTRSWTRDHGGRWQYARLGFNNPGWNGRGMWVTKTDNSAPFRSDNEFSYWPPSVYGLTRSTADEIRFEPEPAITLGELRAHVAEIKEQIAHLEIPPPDPYLAFDRWLRSTALILLGFTFGAIFTTLFGH